MHCHPLISSNRYIENSINIRHATTCLSIAQLYRPLMLIVIGDHLIHIAVHVGAGYAGDKGGGRGNNGAR